MSTTPLRPTSKAAIAESAAPAAPVQGPGGSFVASALMVGAVYLAWRVTTLGSGWMLALSVPLFALEAAAYLDLVLLRAQVGGRWRGSSDPVAIDLRGGPSVAPVDIAVVCGDGGALDVTRSLLAAERVRGRGETVVIDDQDRADIRAAVEQAAARYQVDTDAGRRPLVAVHRHTTSERYLWLRAGDVVGPEAIEAASTRMASRYDGPRSRIAVCQIAVEVFNADDLDHLHRRRDDDLIVNRVIGPALDRWRVAPWLGSASLIDRSAIDQIGDRTTEWSPTAVAAHLHHLGWGTAFESRALIDTTAPDRLAPFLAERRRRSAECWRAAFAADGPLRSPGTPAAVRVAHLGAVARHLAGLRQLALFAVLVAVLLTATVPTTASPGRFVPSATIVVVVSYLARRSMLQGHRRLGDTLRQAWRTVDADMAGLTDAVTGRRRSGPDQISVGSSPRLGRLSRLRLLDAAVVALDVVLVLRTATIVRPDLLPQFAGGWRVTWLLVAAVVLIPPVDVLQITIRRSQRRRHHRVPAVLAAELDGTPATTVDVTPSGIGLILPIKPAVGATATVAVTLPPVAGPVRHITGRAEVRSVQQDRSGRWRVGLELQDLAPIAREALIRFWTLAGRADDPRSNNGNEATGPERPIAVIARPPSRGPLRAVSTLAGIGAVVTVFLGPGAEGALAFGPALVERVCVVDSDGSGRPGIEVERLMAGNAESGTPLGVTLGDGCLTVGADPLTVGFAAVNDGYRRLVQPDEYGGLVAEVAFTRHRVVVVDGDGVAVPGIEVRLHRDRWQPAVAADDGWIVETLDRQPAIAVTLDRSRHVLTVDPAAEPVTTLILPRLRFEPGTTAAEVDRGLGWEPIVDGAAVLPGLVTVRLDDGSILRLDLQAGHQALVPSGLSEPLEPGS